MASAASPSAADPKMTDLCNHTGWVLQTSHSAKYLWRYMVGQWLGFCWFWGWQTSDTRLARQKLGKKYTPTMAAAVVLSHGRHGTPVPTLRQNKISQHTARHVCAFKSRIYFHY